MISAQGKSTSELKIGCRFHWAWAWVHFAMVPGKSNKIDESMRFKSILGPKAEFASQGSDQHEEGTTYY